MKHVITIVAISLGTLLVIFWVLRFAVSDIVNQDPAILETEPWRPFSRLIFGAISVPIILGFVGLFCRALYGNRPNPRPK
jgi:hypothetical protein